MENKLPLWGEQPELDLNGADLDPREGAKINQAMHRLVQEAIGEDLRDTAARDDRVWWHLHEIEEQNGLPYGVTAHDLYQLFRSNYCGE